MMNPDVLLRQYLLYCILPLWIAAGLTDYLLHRRSHIEDTSGTKESALHLLQLSESGIPLLMGLLLDINTLILLLMMAAVVAHEATALWDLHYTIHRRYVGVLEQHVHSFLEILPLMGLSIVALLYWDQFLALFGIGLEPARFEFRLKSSPLPFSYLVGLLSAVGLCIMLPYGEELWRCLSASKRRHRLERGSHRVHMV